MPVFQKQWDDWIALFVFIPIAGFMVFWFSKEFIEVKFISKQSFPLYLSGMLGVVTTIMIAILIGNF